MSQNIIISHDLKSDINAAVSSHFYDKTFIIADETTARLCLPLIADIESLKGADIITIPSSDINKSLDTVTHVWKSLGNMGATRHSCVINVGGGMVTDLGAFAASTFKGGIDFYNIPTTLLAMVDASVGGKTGFNFNGLKNEIGVFNEARTVIISTDFLRTLDSANICSGYAEMLKHALINNIEMLAEHINYDILTPDLQQLKQMIAESINVKEHIVTEDPHEQGIRKALNLGHTIGHAFESMSLKTAQPLLHGYAVAFGMVCELYLSCIKCNFPTDIMRQTVKYIKENYGSFVFTCEQYESLYELMTHDKKNTAGTINFTLLGNVGDIKINQTATKEEVFEALDFLREG